MEENNKNNQGKKIQFPIIAHRYGLDSVKDGPFELGFLSLPEEETRRTKEIAAEGTECKLEDYNGRKANVEIPPYVTVIGLAAFRGNTHIKSITIPPSVTHIMSYAFANCTKLEKVEILGNNLVYIGDLAFSGCFKLKSINIPESLKEIDDCAFNLCESLTKINLPDSLERIGEAAFAACQELHIKRFPKSLTKISAYSFSQIGGVFAIPDWVTEIEDGAFDWTPSSRVFVPISVKKIGYRAFDRNDTDEIHYAGSEEQWNMIEIDNTDDWLKNIKVEFNSSLI